MSVAILADMLLVAPLIYFLATRKTSISKMSALRVFVLGLLVAGFILGSSNPFLAFIKTWISPIVEGVIIVFIVKKFVKANKHTGTTHGRADFLLYCRALMVQVAGNEKAANIISSEIAVFYYACFGKKDKTVDYKRKFTNYKGNGIIMVLWVVLSLFLIETVGMHFLLTLWGRTIAWVLTGLGFYTCIQLYGHIKAIKARPIAIGENALEVHNGLAGDASIKLSNIERVEVSRKKPIDKQAVNIALFKGIEQHSVVVYLKEPITVTKIFGIKRTTDTVLFHVDNAKEFVSVLTSQMV
ncbi:MAG: hypothetical protein QM731_07010 [Chitinophagaceae bacterium]